VTASEICRGEATTRLAVPELTDPIRGFAVLVERPIPSPVATEEATVATFSKSDDQFVSVVMSCVEPSLKRPVAE